ncbi:HNH endonuclease signature motif containing protein [Pseudomonas sp. 10C3]|uniref:HNH endonuclease signature motif containing protein n=1 Tax=Pseudomonas sp. 10C3 TaxID=3118753 RepID=UPI002E818EFA|nr:HNH endonuclease signature motif containing protein [Pseudomonas sp. 10C3]MEE3504855.1 HNH endonuclease signature motif containing protein [Pseudomonas sp. 10C3]
MSMKLDQARLKHLLSYDRGTGIFRWNVRAARSIHIGQVTGCPAGDGGYLQIVLDGKKYFAHRLAWLYVYGHMPGKEVFHKNENRQDNSIENLEVRTATERARSLGIDVRNKSGHLGVAWTESRKKWRASIRLNGKSKSLGYFQHKEDAISARETAIILRNKSCVAELNGQESLK